MCIGWGIEVRSIVVLGLAALGVRSWQGLVISTVPPWGGGGLEWGSHGGGKTLKNAGVSPGKKYSLLFCFHSRSYDYFWCNIFHILIYF